MAALTSLRAQPRRPPSVRPARIPSAFWAASLLFFASGATALAYEVIWFKRFSHVWGSSTLAMAAVVASFLLGLGIGAHVFGRVADRLHEPLRWYGYCEIAIGVLALAIPLETRLLPHVAATFYTHLWDMPAALFLARSSMTFLVIGPPCLLMGGTLPLLVRAWTSADASVDRATGWLYAVNTLGAALGCYVTGFYVLPAIGLYWANLATAALNAAIGIAGVALSRSLRSAHPAEPRSSGREQGTAASRGTNVLETYLVYAASAITGAAALVLQMTWTRQLAVMLGGSTYAFSATLFVILLAIAAGSLAYRFWVYAFSQARHTPGIVVLLIVAGTLAGKWLIPALSDLVGAARDWRAVPAYNAWVATGASMAIELVPAIGMGILFPLLVGRLRSRQTEAGRTVGNVYAWNTAGTITGATLTSAVLFPAVGTAGATAIAMGLYALAAIALWAFQGPRLLTFGIYGIAGVLTVAAAAVPQDPRTTNMGSFLTGPDLARVAARGKVLQFREGAACNVLVMESGDQRALRVNGKTDASTGADMATQLGSAYLPMLLHARPRTALVIGFGSGTTPGAALLVDGATVTCCEIEPAVFAASSHFARVNHQPERSRSFSMVFDDGRSYLQGSREEYDLVISEPSNPWLAGISNLFTTEFYTAVRDKLNQGGILAQWVQTYSFSDAEYGLILRTVASVFPHRVLLTTQSKFGDTVLLASDSPIALTPERMAEAQRRIDESEAIRADLKKYFGTTSAAWLMVRTCLMDPAALDSFAASAGTGINTDLNMRLEFDAPLRLFDRAAATAAVRLTQTAEPQWPARLAGMLGIDVQSAEAQAELGKLLADRDQFVVADRYFAEALRLDARLVECYRAWALMRFRQRQFDDVLDLCRRSLAVESEDAIAHQLIAQSLDGQHRAEEAIRHYEHALRLDPKNQPAANNLAWIRATHANTALRDGAEAVRLARQACEGVWYLAADPLDTLAAAYAEVKQFDKAIAMVDEAIVMAKAAGTLQHIPAMEERRRLYERKLPFHEQPAGAAAATVR